MFMEFIHKSIFGNTVLNYLTAAGIFLFGVVGTVTLRFFVLKRLKKWAERTETQFDDFIVDSLDKFAVPVLYFVFFMTALKSLALGSMMSKGLSAFSVIVVTVAGILFLTHVLRFALFNVYVKRFPGQPDIGNRFRGVMPAISILVWGLGIIFLLDNLGVKISAVMAGLGIGGVAVALAGSVILSDLFAYFAIMIDQPFVIGDFIIIGDFMGSVEKIGVKTTRIRSLGGELLIFSNKDLTDSRIRNYKCMDRRRVVFRLGVTYDTPLQKLKEIPVLIKRIIQGTEDTVFDRAHFFSYGDFNLVIEVVYYVLSADYNKYMDIQQDINFAIKEEFENRGIQFAFPTQTIHLQGATPFQTAN